MTTRLSICIVCLTISPVLSAEPSTRPRDNALAGLRPGHPRLLVLDADVERVRKLIASDPQAKALRDKVHKSALEILDQPTVVHRLIGPRLLDQSRACLARVNILAGMYRLEGDRRFAERAEKEMLAAAAFPDWNPAHFLDTAEMTAALGIGYDWLYHVLPAESRATIRRAIMEKGLREGEKVYHKGGWWVATHNNWNQVCNGGLTVGALAIADEEPELAAYTVDQARRSIPRAMTSFAPDGGCPEGPGYWNYAMQYTAYYLAALNTALGRDSGLAASPGLADTGLFRIHCTGPTGLTFNYADAGPGAGDAPQMFYFARQFKRPVYAYDQRRRGPSAMSFNLFWYDPTGGPDDLAALPTATVFKGINVAFLRSSWSDPDALFVGFKGGDNAASHSHLDLGTFVIEALGQRWAADLGPDDYNMPGYFGNQRWNYYRLRTEGQNTLTINGKNQDPKAKAPIIAFDQTATRPRVVADLSAAYKGQADRVLRGVGLLDGRQVLIQDEINADDPVHAVWTLHTAATVEVHGQSAVLKLGGKTARLQVFEPADAQLTVDEPVLDPPQRPLKDIRRIRMTLNLGAPGGRIAVLFSPGGGPLETPRFEPLSRWAPQPR